MCDTFYPLKLSKFAKELDDGRYPRPAYVYSPNGSLDISAPNTGKKLRTLTAAGGHWNSAVVSEGRLVLPEEDANQHAPSGVLDIYRLG